MASPTTDRRFGLVGSIAFKAPVDIATTGNITLSGEQTIGSFTTSASRVLVWQQTDSTKNGIYDTDTGAWTRAADCDGTFDIVQGTLVKVNSGTYADEIFTCVTSGDITVGTSAILFGAIGGGITTNQVVNVKDQSGVKGDGTTDDYVAIQNALNNGVSLYFPSGVYAHSLPLVYAHGTRVIGAGNWSGAASTFGTTSVSRFKYTGTSAANTVCVRISDAAVGTDPSTASTRDMQNVALSDVVIDGNGLAYMGLYMVRAWSMNKLERITVTNCVQDCFWAAECWGGSPRDWIAYKTPGCGITLGRNDYGWSSATVDQSACINFFSYFCGNDQSANALNVYWDSPVISSATAVGTAVTMNTSAAHGYTTGQSITVSGAVPAAYNGTYTITVATTTQFTYTAGGAPGGAMTTIGVIYDSRERLGYGIGVFGSRGLQFINAQALQCDGAGVYMSTLLMGTDFRSGYVEGNGRSSHSAAQWNVLINGDSSGNTASIEFHEVYMGLTPAILLKGTAPSRVERSILFRGIPILNRVESNHGFYQLINCDRSVNISNVGPCWFDRQRGTARSLSPGGVASFTSTSSTAVASLAEGVISSIAYSTVGTYNVNFGTTLPNAHYMVGLSVGTTNQVNWKSKTTTGFVIENRSGGALSDAGSIIDAIVWPNYST